MTGPYCCSHSSIIAALGCFFLFFFCFFSVQLSLQQLLDTFTNGCTPPPLSFFHPALLRFFLIEIITARLNIQLQIFYI